MSDSGASHIETLEIEQRKLSRYSNGHNFSHGGAIQAHNISRRSKLNNGSSQEIQMDITLNTEVRFRSLIYRDARNWTTEILKKLKWSKLFTRMSDSGTSDIETIEIKKRNLSRNSNGLNISHGGPIQAHHICRRSKLNNGSSRQIRMVINFHTDVWFVDIIYREVRNWTTKAIDKFEW